MRLEQRRRPASSSSVRWAKPSASRRSTSASKSSSRARHPVGSGSERTRTYPALLLSVLKYRLSVPIGVPPMAVDRLLPTQEAEDLLALTREIADKELAPRVEEHERAETLPGGPVRHPRRGRPARPALPRGGRRRGPALRGLPAGARGAGRALGRGGRRGERARAVLLPARHVRHPSSRSAGCPTMLAGELIGGYSLSEPQAGSDAAALRVQGREGRRGLPDHRHQGVDHPRRPAPTSTRCSPAPARARAASPASSRPGRPRA